MRGERNDAFGPTTGDDDIQREPSSATGSDRRGSITSFLGLILVALSIACVTANVAIPTETNAEWLIRSIATLGVVIVASIAAILVGLRSASKPKGHVGRGRGLATVIMGALMPAVAFSVMVLSMHAIAREVMKSGLVMHVTERATGKSSLVTPIGSHALTEQERHALETLDLMPDIATYDDEQVPVEATDGVLSVNGTEVEPNGSTMESLTEELDTMQRNGYQIRMGADGKIYGTDADGNDVTVSITQDGVNIQTDSNMTFEELMERGSEFLAGRS